MIYAGGEGHTLQVGCATYSLDPRLPLFIGDCIQSLSQRVLRLMIEILHYLIKYGNYGTFFIMGNAGFISSTVGTVMGDTSLNHNSIS